MILIGTHNISKNEMIVTVTNKIMLSFIDIDWLPLLSIP